MSVQVRIPTILRSYTGGAAEVVVELTDTRSDDPGANAGPGGPGTLADVIASMDTAYPGIGGRILDDTGKLRRFVNVYVGDTDVRFADGLGTEVPAGAEVSVIPAVAGG